MASIVKGRHSSKRESSLPAIKKSSEHQPILSTLPEFHPYKSKTSRFIRSKSSYNYDQTTSRESIRMRSSSSRRVIGSANYSADNHVRVNRSGLPFVRPSNLGSYGTSSKFLDPSLLYQTGSRNVTRRLRPCEDIALQPPEKLFPNGVS